MLLKSIVKISVTVGALFAIGGIACKLYYSNNINNDETGEKESKDHLSEDDEKHQQPSQLSVQPTSPTPLLIKSESDLPQSIPSQPSTSLESLEEHGMVEEAFAKLEVAATPLMEDKVKEQLSFGTPNSTTLSSESSASASASSASASLASASLALESNMEDVNVEKISAKLDIVPNSLMENHNNEPFSSGNTTSSASTSNRNSNNVNSINNSTSCETINGIINNSNKKKKKKSSLNSNSINSSSINNCGTSISEPKSIVPHDDKEGIAQPPITNRPLKKNKIVLFYSSSSNSNNGTRNNNFNNNNNNNRRNNNNNININNNNNNNNNNSNNKNNNNRNNNYNINNNSNSGKYSNNNNRKGNTNNSTNNNNKSKKYYSALNNNNNSNSTIINKGFNKSVRPIQSQSHAQRSPSLNSSPIQPKKYMVSSSNSTSTLDWTDESPMDYSKPLVFLDEDLAKAKERDLSFRKVDERKRLEYRR